MHHEDDLCQNDVTNASSVINADNYHTNGFIIKGFVGSGNIGIINILDRIMCKES